jgi:hypothetical protein
VLLTKYALANFQLSSMYGPAVGQSIEIIGKHTLTDSHYVGGEYTPIPLPEITTTRLRANFNMAFEANFCKHSRPSASQLHAKTLT